VSVQQTIHDKLAGALGPEHLDVENESGMHNVPKGSETHFKVTVVSPAFEGKGRVDRHRRVHELLAEELRSGVHALSVRALTPDEWRREAGATFASPPCLGGSKKAP
jgi:stress-induced morphogen